MSRDRATISDDEVERVLANRNAAYARWALNFPHPRVETRAGLHLVDTGLASAELNVAFVLEPSAAPATAIEAAAQFYADRPAAWRIEVLERLRESWEGPVVSAGRTELEVRPGMLLREAAPVLRPPSGGLSIQTVEAEADSERFARALAAGFGYPPRPEALTARFHGAAGRTCYLGVVDGRDVATAVGFRHRGVTGIYAVSTVEGARRHGYGSALTARAMADGRAAGLPDRFPPGLPDGRARLRGDGLPNGAPDAFLERTGQGLTLHAGGPGRSRAFRSGPRSGRVVPLRRRPRSTVRRGPGGRSSPGDPRASRGRRGLAGCPH